jgi:hypothetical protein
MKKVAKKGPARVVAVGPSQVALFRSHGKKPDLTAANLAKYSTMTSGEADDESVSSSSDDCDNEIKSIAISEAMSIATTTFSTATVDYNIQQTTHAKQRQHQRGIHRREIQSAVKFHAVATRARYGRKIIQGEDGVAVVVSGGEKNIVISTWREANEGDDPTERWNEETEFETKVLLSARVIRMFPFLFPKDGRTKAVPMNDTAVLKACDDYFGSSEYGTGGTAIDCLPCRNQA